MPRFFPQPTSLPPADISSPHAPPDGRTYRGLKSVAVVGKIGFEYGLECLVKCLRIRRSIPSVFQAVALCPWAGVSQHPVPIAVGTYFSRCVFSAHLDPFGFSALPACSAGVSRPPFQRFLFRHDSARISSVAGSFLWDWSAPLP